MTHATSDTMPDYLDLRKALNEMVMGGASNDSLQSFINAAHARFSDGVGAASMASRTAGVVRRCEWKDPIELAMFGWIVYSIDQAAVEARMPRIPGMEIVLRCDANGDFHAGAIMNGERSPEAPFKYPSPSAALFHAVSDMTRIADSVQGSTDDV